MNPIQQRTDLSLTSLFNALQKPHSSTSQKCKAQIKAASVKEIDYTFRKINHYKRKGDWSQSRLVRCIDYLAEHLAKLEPIVQLPSFVQCMSWLLDAINTTAEPQQTSQVCMRVIAKTLERARSFDMTKKQQLLNTVSHKMQPEHWLFHHSLPAVRIYALRAMVTHTDFFAPKLSGCIPACLQQLTRIPALLYTLSLRPRVTDYDEKKAQLEQLVMYVRLLEGPAVMMDSNEVERLVEIWTSVARAYNEENGLAYKNREVLLYGLTSALYRSASSVSLSTTQSTTLLCLIDRIMRRWARDVCCSMHPPLCAPHVLEVETNVLKKCLRIALVSLTKEDENYQRHLVLGTINFFMCYVGQPVSPEETMRIGTETWISTDMCVDVDERGYQVQLLPKHQDLLNLLLEVFMQNVQRMSRAIILPLAGRVAWCIKSFFTILLGEQTLFQSLLHRLEKMTVFFLHFDEAIDVLAASSTNISQYLWTPTIEQAKQGLVSDSPDVLAKAKRAFIALEKISHHPRACERLVDGNVLQLVSTEWTAKRPVVYALFGRFMASLLHRTAFVRTRLRDELDLFPIIIRLLGEAVTHRATQRKEWDHVVLGCLAVVRTFQYDETSMRIWLQQSELLPLMLRILVDETDAQVMLATLGLLEQFAVQPLCGVQVMTEVGALTTLAVLLEHLTGEEHGTLDWDHKEEETKEEHDGEEGEKEDQDNMEEEEEEPDLESEDHPIAFTNIIDLLPPPQEEHPQEQQVDDKDRIRLACADYLKRALVKILTCHDNMQFTLLCDAFSQVFQPLTSPRWRRLICQDLYQKKMADLQTLYHFTDNTEHAQKLHALTAVAIGYAAIGAPTPEAWNMSLGLHQDISVSVFGILCQMLLDSPKTRDVAAQVMASLGSEYKETWRSDAESQIDLPEDDAPSSLLPNDSDLVEFKADDSATTVSANRELLCRHSPIFEAMLSATFVESTLQVIPLHDVTFQHLVLFLRLIETPQADILHEEGENWPVVIRLLQLADRFDTRTVKRVCEHWILQRIVHPTGEATWGGLVSLYRICRDRERTSPFVEMVNAAAQSILVHLTVVCRTPEFDRMIKEDEEAAEMLCEAFRILLIK